MSRNYIRGIKEAVVKLSIGENAGLLAFIQRGGVYVNGFSALRLFTDDLGTVELVEGVDFETGDSDPIWTANEVDHTDQSIFAEYKVTNVTYQNIPLFADFDDFGVYTDSDAPYSAVGVAVAVSSSVTITPSVDAIRTIVTSDTSGGNNFLLADAPKFIGQEILFLSSGVGLTELDFPGKIQPDDYQLLDGDSMLITAISSTDWTTGYVNPKITCKAWINFNGTGVVSIRDNFNFSSVTDNGVGDYTVNLTNDMKDANYSVSTAGGELESDSRAIISVKNILTTSITVISHTDTGVKIDRDLICAQAFGS